MQKLFEVAYNKFNVRPNQCRFIFDGEILKETDTPRSLNMDDGDIVDIMEEQVGGTFYM